MIEAAPQRETIRLDKWLWHARFLKARVGATALVSEGHVRVNSERVTKPARAVGPGDVLTFSQGDLIRVVRIVAIGARRGPAAEAQMLYEDLMPQGRGVKSALDPSLDGKGRHDKAETPDLEAPRIPVRSSPLE